MMQTGICSEDMSGAREGVAAMSEQDDLDLIEESDRLRDMALVESADSEESDEEAASEREPTFAEKLYCLEQAVTRHPLNREILYSVLGYCSAERNLSDVEEYISSLPQFKTATQNPYRMIETLVKSYGLDVIEYDGEGEIVYSDVKEVLTEDEIDDLVVTTCYKTTDVGSSFFEQHSPKARIVELFNLTPERADAYQDVLAFIAESPKTYKEVSDFLQGSPALITEIDGRKTAMQPSVFLDKLERAGALVWNEKWELSEEGGEFLDELKGR